MMFDLLNDAAPRFQYIMYDHMDHYARSLFIVSERQAGEWTEEHTSTSEASGYVTIKLSCFFLLRQYYDSSRI